MPCRGREKRKCSWSVKDEKIQSIKVMKGPKGKMAHPESSLRTMAALED